MMIDRPGYAWPAAKQPGELYRWQCHSDRETIMTLICRLLDHKPNRGAAGHDGQDYWTTCRRCGAPLIRDMHGWRRGTEAELDFHLRLRGEAARQGRRAGFA